MGTAATVSAADPVHTIYAWPLSSPSPVPIAEVHITPSPDSPVATLLKYTPPSVAQSDHELVRIGLFDRSTKAWTGTATSSLSFGPDFDRTITLHVASPTTPELTRVGFGAAKVPEPKKLTKKERAQYKKEGKSTKKQPKREGETKVEVVMPAPAPVPHLNKPVQLNLDGKVPVKEEDQKSFLQK